MSRYISVDTIVFDDPIRGQVNIKDRRDIPSEDIAFTEPIENGDLLDEVATRPRVFGVGGETQVYRIFDANTKEIVANGWSLERIKRLKIPRG